MKTPTTKSSREKSIRKKLEKYFDKDSIEVFLHKRNSLLGARPIDLLSTKKGFVKLREFIEGIEAGSFM